MKDVKSMKNTEIAEKVKSAIIKDLFADVDTQKCAIDIFLQNPKTFEKTANTLNKESISFLNKCHQQLKAESDNLVEFSIASKTLDLSSLESTILSTITSIVSLTFFSKVISSSKL